MAAVVVRSHCEDSRDSGYLERKIPRRRIGLDDDMNAGCCTLDTRRCASSCVERDLAHEETTPLSSQVRKINLLSAFFYPVLPLVTPESNCGELSGFDGQV